MKPVTVYLFGGPLDGEEKHFAFQPKEHLARVPGRKEPAHYQHSREWSDYFERLTFTPQDFPGRPPHRELQPA